MNSDTESDAGNDVTSNLAIRQAISYAVDRQSLCDVVFYGHATPAYSNSPRLPWENLDTRAEHNPDKAKSILEADGWTLNSDGIYEKDGLVAEFTVTCYASEIRMALLAALKEQQVFPHGMGWSICSFVNKWSWN